MSRKLEPQRRRIRIQLSVDPKIWARCQAVSEIAGPKLSWSQIAEEAFTIVLDGVDQLRDEVVSKLRPDATSDEINAAMAAFLSRQVHGIMQETYAQLDQEFPVTPKPLNKAPKTPKRGADPG